MTGHRKPLHIVDFCVIGITLLISLSIGLYYAVSGSRPRTTADYFIGGRKINWLPTTISLLVTFESSILMLGYPAEVYVYGIQFFLSSLGCFFGYLMVPFIAVPLFQPLKITSAYEYLELRYKSRFIYLLGTVMGILSNLLYMGIVLYGPALAVDAVTGFPQIWSILLVGLGSTIYTSIGGLKAVIWTDVFQTVIMFTGVFALLIQGTITVGGPRAVWNLANEGGRLNFFNFDMDPTVRHTFWNLLIGNIAAGLYLGFNQSGVQRILSQKSMTNAKRMWFLVAPLFLITCWMAMYEGIVAYAYYATTGCDPLAAGDIGNPNQIIVHMVVGIFQELPGMAGIFLASLFSAAFSTLSSGLSSCSSNIWQDLVRPLLSQVSEKRATIIAKILVVVCGGIACGTSVLISFIGSTLNQITLSILSSFSGPLLGLFLQSCLFPWVNKWGAIAGTFASLVVSCWFGFGSNFANLSVKTPWLPPAPTNSCLLTNISTVSSFTQMLVPNGITQILNNTVTIATEAHTEINPLLFGFQKVSSMSYTWYLSFATLVSLVVGSLVSVCTGRNKNNPVDSQYILPWVNTLCLRQSESLQQQLISELDVILTKDKSNVEGDQTVQAMAGRDFGSHTPIVDASHKPLLRGCVSNNA